MKIHSSAQIPVTTPAAEADHAVPAHAAANAPTPEHTSAPVMPNKLLLNERPIRVGSFDPLPDDEGDWLKRTLAVALVPTGASARIDTPPEYKGITCIGDQWHEYPANRLPDEPDAPLNPSQMRVLVSASGHLKFIAERQAEKGFNEHKQEALVSLIHAPTLTNLPNKVLGTIVGYAAPNVPEGLKPGQSDADVPGTMKELRKVSKRLQQAVVGTMTTKQNFYMGAGRVLYQLGHVSHEHIEALAARDPVQQWLVYPNFAKLMRCGLSHADIVNASGLDETALKALLEHGPTLAQHGLLGFDIVTLAAKPERLAFFARHAGVLKSLDLSVQVLDRIAGAPNSPQPSKAMQRPEDAFATAMAKQIVKTSTNFGQGPQTQPIKDLIADVLQNLSGSDTAYRDAAIDTIVRGLSGRVVDLEPSHIAESLSPHPALDSVKAYTAQLAGMRSTPKPNTPQTSSLDLWPR